MEEVKIIELLPSARTFAPIPSPESDSKHSNESLDEDPGICDYKGWSEAWAQ